MLKSRSIALGYQLVILYIHITYIHHLHLVADVDDDGILPGLDVDPLAVVEDLKAADAVLKQ
jgi:hypothetical protein